MDRARRKPRTSAEYACAPAIPHPPSPAGRSLSAAAYEASFADAAHLTRTCNQMFGIPPSVMLRDEFFEIPSPFQPVSADGEGARMRHGDGL